jgi:ribosomal protein S27AE
VAKRLSLVNINRLNSLLDMWYLPSEIAEETGLAVATIYRTFVTAGCPHRRDDTGHIWIRGTEFAAWLIRRNTKTPKKKMAANQAYCFRCHRPVVMAGDITTEPSNKYLENMRATCPICGGVVMRARKKML